MIGRQSLSDSEFRSDSQYYIVRASILHLIGSMVDKLSLSSVIVISETFVIPNSSRLIDM